MKPHFPENRNDEPLPGHAGGYLTKEQLRQRLNLPSQRKVEEMMKAKMIPYLKWGAKTVRFDYLKVKLALDKFEHKAIGQK